MKSFAIWVTSLALVLGSVRPSQAQDLPTEDELREPCSPDLREPRGGLVTVEGVQARWFHLEVARCMLGRLALLPEFARHIRLLEDRLALTAERDALRAREVALAVEQAETASEALEAALRAQNRAQEALTARWRSPWLWLTVGLVLGVGLVALAGYVVNKL